MAQWISISDAIELYGISKESIHTGINFYKKEHKKDPEWVKRVGRAIRINVDGYYRWDKIDKEAWTYNTDPDGIYFAIQEVIGCSDHRLAEWLCEHSHKYKSKMAWVMFLNKNAWNFPMNRMVNYRHTMQMDFLNLGSYLLWQHGKEYKAKMEKEAK